MGNKMTGTDEIIELLRNRLNRVEGSRDQAIQAALDGLYTDGSHHKQYYLEQVILFLTGQTVEDYLESNDPEAVEIYGLPEKGTS